MITNVQQLLTKYSCNDFFVTSELTPLLSHYHKPPTKPIYINEDCTVKEACEALHSNRISSVPVLSKDGFTSQIEYFDLVRHVLEILSQTPDNGHDFTISDILASHSNQGHPVSTLEKHRPIVLVQKETLLVDVVHEFVRSKAHRVAVLDKTQFIGVISQSAISSLVVSIFGLRKEKGNDWPLGRKTLKELNVIQRKVITCTETNTVMDALFTMYLNNISSIAIIRGLTLRGTISMSDVKMILQERNGWKKVFQSCGAFFKDLRIQQRYFLIISMEHEGKAIQPVFTVQEGTSLIVAMEKMVATKTHRVWVTKDTEEIVGLVSLSDIMPLLLQ